MFRIREAQGRGTPFHAHQLYLHVLAETGVVGFVLLFLAWGSVTLPPLIRIFRDRIDSPFWAIRWGLLTSLGATLFHSFTDAHLLLIPHGFIFWLNAALLAQFTNGFESSPSAVPNPSKSTRLRCSLILLACFLILVLTFAPILSAGLRDAGKLALKKKQYDKAISTIQMGVYLQPMYWIPRRDLAIAYEGRFHNTRNQGDLEKAVSCFQDAIHYNPHFSPLYEAMGVFLLENADFLGADALRRAEETLLLSLGKNSHYQGSYNTLGVVYQLEGRLKEAELRYLQAVEIDSMSFDTWSNLQVLYTEREDYDNAEKACRRLIELKPQDASLLLRLGNVLFKAKKYVDAKRVYEMALQTDSLGSDAYNDLGNIYYMTGDYRAAIGEYEKALQMKPEAVLPRQNIERAQTLLENQERLNQKTRQ